MRVHLLAQPNSQTNQDYVLDGFTQMVIRFSKVLHNLGIHTILYGSEESENEALCDEFVSIISKEEQELALFGWPYYKATRKRLPNPWTLGNQRMIDAIGPRKQLGDIICSIGGQAQKEVSNAHPDVPTLEFAIGYPGSYAPYRVFQSYAWMHCVYGMEPITTGRPMDTVIHGFVDPPQHPFVAEADDYLLYVGRLVPRKGLTTACETARMAGLPLKLIGFGDVVPSYGELLPHCSKRERDYYYSRARAVICATEFIEPFNMVAVEAQSYGTPVISTNWGGFTETVEHGRTGYRCHTADDFVTAAENVKYAISRSYVAQRATRFSIETATEQYRVYLERLARYLLDHQPSL